MQALLPGEKICPLLTRMGADPLISEDGRKALKEKLITTDQLRYCSKEILSCLVTNNGRQALREGLITIERAKNIQGKDLQNSFYESENLRMLQLLLSNNGLTALRLQLIKTNQIGKDMCSSWLKNLTSDKGLKVLKEKLITLDQVQTLRWQKADMLISENGLEALMERLITFDQATQLDRVKLYYAVSENGRKALEAKLMTIDDMRYMDSEIIEVLIEENGRKALEEKLITLDKVKEFKPSQVEFLLSDEGQSALKNKVITLANIKSGAWLSSKGIKLIKAKLINETDSINDNGLSYLDDTKIIKLINCRDLAFKADNIIEYVHEQVKVIIGSTFKDELENVKRIIIKNMLDELLIKSKITFISILEVTIKEIVNRHKNNIEKEKINNEDFKHTPPSPRK